MAASYATLHAGELVDRTAPLSWIVEGLLLEAGAGILGGAPKSCKSYFALDRITLLTASRTVPLEEWAEQGGASRLRVREPR